MSAFAPRKYRVSLTQVLLKKRNRAFPGEFRRGLSFQVFEQKSFRDRDLNVEPRDLALGDVDGDGRPDLVLLVHDRILVYRQDTGKPDVAAAKADADDPAPGGGR